MLTDKAVNEIRAEKHKLSRKFIREFDADWTAAVNRVKSSGKRLWCMPIVPAQREYKNMRT